MAKKRIAVVAYSLTIDDPLTVDSIAFMNCLNQSGVYNATLVSQSCLDETSKSYWEAARWKRFAGVVITNFYQFWNLRELILAKLPVICANVGYVDDLGLAEMPQEHIIDHQFNVILAHPITSGFPLGGLDIGNAVWVDSTSTLDHNVNSLITTAANRAVLVAHKTHKLVYFGWYRLSFAQPNSPLFKLLLQSAKWTF
jgi:hypothetical protein